MTPTIPQGWSNSDGAGKTNAPITETGATAVNDNCRMLRIEGDGGVRVGGPTRKRERFGGVKREQAKRRAEWSPHLRPSPVASAPPLGVRGWQLARYHGIGRRF